MKRRRKKTVLDVAAEEAEKWSASCRTRPSFCEVLVYALAWKDGFDAAEKAVKQKEEQTK